MAPTIFDILLCTGGVCVTVERNRSDESSESMNLHHRARKKRRTRKSCIFQRTKTMKISPTKFTKFERAIAREGGYVLVNPRIHTIQSDYRLEQAWIQKQQERANANKKSNNEMSKSKYAIALRRMRSSSRKLL